MNTRKKIVLIDLDCVFINSLSLSKKLVIDTLIVGTDNQIASMKSKYQISNILSMESINNFYLNQNIELDYTILELFRNTELKVEHFLSRVTTDINSIQYIYYSALSYWILRFKNNNIYGVISSNIEFGATFDSIIYDVANFYNKKVYIMEVALSNGCLRTNQLFDYIEKKYLAIDLKRYNLNGIDKKDFIFNSYVTNKNKNKNITSIKKFIIKKLETIGGYLLVAFVALLLRRYKSIHHTFNICWWQYFSNYFYVKRMIKYYNSLCTEFDESKKYIYYPLHMEPEAATQNRTIFSNQLIIIKTIAQNLPNGWILYIKEHPHQYANMNDMLRYYYLSSIEKFKTKRYYDEIKKIDNVKLLKLNVPSKSVLANAQAIASINGTIILEAIILKKAILSFSQKTTPFVYVNGVFDIKNEQECKTSLDLIEQGYLLNYENIDEIIENYFYVIENNNSNNFCLLIEDLLL